MTVYAVALINIADHGRYQPYVTGWFDIWKNYSGEILAIEDEPAIKEGHWPFYRTVILSFPDEKAFTAWYESPEYRELVKHRYLSSVGSMALLKAFVMPEGIGR